LRIQRLLTNHLVNPMGYDLSDTSIRVSFVVEDTAAKKMETARVEVATDEAFENLVHDSGKSKAVDSLAYKLPIETKPYTRYFWRVSVWADNGDFATSETAWFETAKQNEAWQAEWITTDFDQLIHPVMMKSFTAAKKVKQARAYVCGLGLYELYINGVKAGDEYLAPFCNAYDKWLQYQTYDVTEMLGTDNRIEIPMGEGWYKGRFGWGDGCTRKNLFGDHFALICEVHVAYEDGTTEVVCTDNTWQARKGCVQFSNIYDGEVYDATFAEDTLYAVKPVSMDSSKLKARLSPPVKIMERIKPIAILHTPKGETVIDMGQIMTGWLEFKTNAPKGTRIFLQHGEILQEECFFNLNLRDAKAEYTYIADGKEAVVRPHFTFYGFRYVKVEGWGGELFLDDFSGCVVYSEMQTTGYVETSDPLVNKLFLNAMWGQKGNFLDVPTDCPQRDERMGWTGDAQVFCGTASFNMDTYAFYNKYLYDLYEEQKTRNGCVPHVIPDMIMNENIDDEGSSAWGDAATIMPWNTYLFYGDVAILEQQFDSMKAWVDRIRRLGEANGNRNLWMSGFHFGDWLAIDESTDPHFIASAYYYYSTERVVKAARVLGKKAEEAEYTSLMADIKKAIHGEFFTASGRLAVPSQTGMVLALFMDFVAPEHKTRLVADLRKKMGQNRHHLTTGFVGTPYLNRTLSDNGMNDISYMLLMNKDYPSWLYEVIMGATTIWERWNSLLPDGTISDLTMNSFNHYAYGSVIEWVYRNIAGLQPCECAPGFRKIVLAPLPDKSLQWVRAQYDSASGRYESAWTMETDGALSFAFTIPFNAEAELVLPHVTDSASVSVNGKAFVESGLSAVEEGDTLRMTLTSGTYSFTYKPTVQ